MKKVTSIPAILYFIFFIAIDLDSYAAALPEAGFVPGSVKAIRRQFSSYPFSNHFAAKPLSQKSFHPQAENRNTVSLDFSGTLAGNWQEIIGNVCFWHTYPGSQETQLILIIGLPAVPTGNGNYKTTGWDKKVFWIDVGDGVPMHLPMQFTTSLDENGNPVTDSKSYTANNLFYRLPGKDYSKFEFGGQMANMWISTDLDNTPLYCSIDLYDENGEYTETVEPKAGDQIQSWTSSIAVDEPGAFYMTTMEDTYRTITRSMRIFYDHLTPNVDFDNAKTKDLIDFSEVELIYILSAMNVDDMGIPTYGLSTPVNSNTKWKNIINTFIPLWNLLDF